MPNEKLRLNNNKQGVTSGIMNDTKVIAFLIGVGNNLLITPFASVYNHTEKAGRHMMPINTIAKTMDPIMFTNPNIPKP